MDKNTNFIITESKQSRDELIKLGLNMIQENDEHYVFLNCIEKLNFSNVKDCVFTNKLCI